MSAPRENKPGHATADPGWLPIVAVLCGILSLALLLACDDSSRCEEFKGVVTLGMAGAGIGILCVAHQARGRVSAVIAIVTGAASSIVGIARIISMS